MGLIDWPVTLRSSLVAVALIALGVGVAVVGGVDDTSGAGVALAYLVWVVVALFAAGVAAGAARLELPLLHGGIAAVLASLMTMAGALLAGTWTTAGGTAVRVIALVALAATAGAGGGLTADWWHRHRLRRAADRV
ncbi:MAG: hypothetical protein AAGD35_20550 [Actinomycetota bacterium]